MVTAVYSLGQVVGADLWLGGYLVCALLYVAVCLLFRFNRCKKGLLAVALAFLLAEIVCDGIWYATFYPNGTYENPSLAGAGALLVWPALLCLAGAAVSMFNSFSAEKGNAQSKACDEK